MELFLIRHGQSVNNSLPEEQRVEDPPLTQLGQQQAECLAEWIGQMALTRLITSPFRRTLETTEPIRCVTALSPEVRAALHEQGGCMRGPTPLVMEGRPGMTRAEIQAEFSGYDVAKEIDGKGWWNNQPYESVKVARRRAETVADDTCREFAGTDHRVAYVMHNMFIQLLIPCFLPDCKSVGEVYNTAVSKLVISPDAIELDYCNRIDHLTSNLVTI